MRHTQLLRQLVRETLLSEAAITPDRAAKGGLTFLASVNDIDSPSGVAAIDVFLNREDKPPVIVGRLRSRAASGQPCGNPHAWVISLSKAYRRRGGVTPTLDRLSSLGVVRLTKN